MPDDKLTVLAWAAALLSFERLFYVWVSRAPDRLRAWCAAAGTSKDSDAVMLVAIFFCTFKVIQASVFIWWCYVFGHGRLDVPAAGVVVVGAGAIAVGQFVNLTVFYRLGSVGVFYGSELGHAMPRVRGFPFSLFTHPQYVGTVVSIWGLFLIARFPRWDWWILPVLETAYYSLGAHLEGAPATNDRLN